MKNFKFFTLAFAMIASSGFMSSCSKDSDPEPEFTPGITTTTSADIIGQLNGKIWHLYQKAEYEYVYGEYLLDEVKQKDEDWKCYLQSDGSARFAPTDDPTGGLLIPKGATNSWSDSKSHSSTRAYNVNKINATEFVLEEVKPGDEKKVYYFTKK